MKVIIKNIIIIGLFCASTFAQSMEKTTVEKHKEFLAQQKEPSNLMRWVNKKFGKFVLNDFASKPASSFHQEMWKNAQNDLNIPEQYHASIVAFDHEKVNLRVSNKLSISGNMKYKMYVNQEIEISYSLSRFNDYHEAAHHKHLDPFNGWKRELLFKISDVVLTSASAFGLSHTLLYTIAKINPRISSIVCNFPATAYLTSHIITVPLSFVLRNYAILPLINKNLEKYSQLYERRADLVAAYAIKCYQCVHARADDFKNKTPEEQKFLAKKGYVSWQELEEIAQEHKKNGLVCDYHKK